MNKKTGRLELLEKEKIPKALLKLAIPSILATLVTTIYNFVDTIYIGQLSNNSMLAATTVVLPLLVIIQAIGEAIGASSGSYISRQLGAKKYDQVSRIVHTSMTLGLIFSIVLPIVFITFLDPILLIFNSDPEVLFYCKEYVIVLLMCSFSVILKLIASHLLRAEGDIQFPLFAIFAGVVLNIFLDPFFMFEWGLNLGIFGAALATAVSQIVSTVLMLLRLVLKANYVVYRFKWMLDREIIAKLASMGSAVFTRQALPSISYGCLAIAAAKYGTDFVAGIGLAKKSMQIIMFMFIGYSQGYQPFAAYNYGAKNWDRVKKGLNFSIVLTTVYGLCTMLLFMFNAPLIIGIFTNDPLVIEVGKLMLYGYSVSFPILGLYNVLASHLQALGKSRESFFVSVARQGLFYVPLICIAPLFFNQLGIFTAQPIADYLTILVILYLCRNLKAEYH